MPTSVVRIRLAEFAFAISLASDLGLGHPLQMVLATCLLSLHLGELLGLSDDELCELYYVALLRHAGCTADAPRAAEAYGDDTAMSPAFLAAVDPTRPWTLMAFMWRNMYQGRPFAERIQKLVQLLPGFMEAVLAHCEVAQLFARRLGLPAAVQSALLQCNEDWNGHGIPGHLKGEAIARSVRVMRVAEEAIFLTHFASAQEVAAAVRKRGGVTLDPAIAERFSDQAEKLLAQASLTSPSLRAEALAAEPGPRPLMTEAQLEAGAQGLADFADLKSPHLVGHSAGVGHLAAKAAVHYGLTETDATGLRRAGYVQDLGRVGISAGIWCKPGPLTTTEWEKVRLHPYYTGRVLAEPEALAAWATLATTHHERLDGSGYYRNLPGALLTPAMRILAAADAYRAMTEPRPYRAALLPEQAADELKREARAGRLDGQAVNSILSAAGQRTPEIRREHVAGLTERELEVLRLVARGLSNRAIAQQLSISEKTVGNHLQNTYSKISVSTRAAATYFALQHSLV